MADFFFNALMGAAAAKKADPDFTIDLNITSSNLTFGVTPYWGAGGWCSIVDWGDGSTQAATTSGTELTHTYAAAGTYRVKVRGDMYRFRVGSTNPAAVIDCNCNWEALGTLTSGLQMFMNCGNAAFTIRRLPDTLRDCSFLCYQLSQSDITLESLPASLSAGKYMFFLCFMASFDINSLANKVGSWDNVVDIENMFRRAGESTGTVTGHVASFMRKLPNANSVAQSFQGTNTTTFGASDYFEITLTTTEANQVWGFTATSSAGRWYCFDWGDGTAVTANKNLDVFTSGTKVTHTFATPGTYHIKLATAPCSIVFDQYDSDNGNWEALGYPAEGIAGVFVKEGTTTVSSAMTMSGATITSGQSQMVYDRGMALYTTINSGGTMYVSSGGTGENATIYSGGTAHIYGVLSGASALEMTANIVVYSGGTVNNAHLPLGTLLVSSGGFADGVVVSGNAAASRGTLTIRAGGSADHVSALRYENVYVDGYITNLLLGSGPGGGVAYIRPSGVASGVDVRGALVVSSGASALAVTSNAGAVVTVQAGGYIEYVTP